MKTAAESAIKDASFFIGVLPSLGLVFISLNLLLLARGPFNRALFRSLYNLKKWFYAF